MKNGVMRVGENSFDVEIAKSLLEKARGLAGRKTLEPNKGMLFEFAFQFIYPFTMRGTLIPLDIIWMDKKYQIVHIAKKCEPCKSPFSLLCPAIFSLKKAKYVLEINAGLCDKLGIKIGDTAILVIPSRNTE